MSSTARRSTRLVVLPGDGIGPEITTSTVAVLEEVDRLFDLGLEMETYDVGLKALAAYGSTFPDQVWEAASTADAVVLGPGSRHAYPPLEEGGLPPSGELRKRLDLYANIRPAKSRPGVPVPCGKPCDLVIVRENTEGFYADRNMFRGHGEFMPTADVALSVRKVTRQGSLRIAESAFSLAMRRRKKVTAVSKFNVLQYSDGLFLECVRSVAERYPAVEYDEKYIDATTALLVRDPRVFDVIVTTNMYGDILSDLASELSGSLGLGASVNASAEFAMAQAQHGSAPDIEGKDLANPVSLVSSAAMLLGWLGERRGARRFIEAADLIEAAIDAVLSRPDCRTRDLGGQLGTKAFTERLVSQLGADHRGAAA
jgi:isocitrate/isopropylmalate dehydrogenase